MSAGNELLQELLAVATEAAAAGAAVLQGRPDGALAASNKASDSDWVTEFDVAAEKAVRAVLAERRPHDSVTGEELGTTVAEGSSGVRWSVDPLDGTTNFIRDIAYYCTSVAAVTEDGEWLAGVVQAPVLGRRYWAVRGGGAWCESRSGVRRLTGPEPGRRGKILATGLSYDPATRVGQYRQLPRLMEGFGDLRRLGSAALDLCLVADGTHDAYIERGLNEHDFAAGALIAEEAGAAVWRPVLDPSLPEEERDEQRLNSWLMACAPDLEARLREAV